MSPLKVYTLTIHRMKAACIQRMLAIDIPCLWSSNLHHCTYFPQLLTNTLPHTHPNSKPYIIPLYTNVFNMIKTYHTHTLNVLTIDRRYVQCCSMICPNTHPITNISSHPGPRVSHDCSICLVRWITWRISCNPNPSLQSVLSR